ncbi:MAG: hypothetical protein II859_10735 [Bacteroidales bacterium]|nr:hypothetical protein [Bacteroidales bacterium]
MAKNISKTLIIGLGGTGQTVIREIKKRMLRTYGEIPDLVKFRGSGKCPWEGLTVS